MSIVNVYYETYPCPHCKGKIVLRRQVGRESESCSMEHQDENGKVEELKMESSS